MKLWEFDYLCRTEWENGEGNVRTLWLLEDSLKELQADMTEYALRGGGKMLPVRVEDIEKLRDGGYPMYIVNPVTRTDKFRGEVHMHICRDQDAADVFFPDGHFETHILARK